jgi:hypothetical protein
LRGQLPELLFASFFCLRVVGASLIDLRIPLGRISAFPAFFAAILFALAFSLRINQSASIRRAISADFTFAGRTLKIPFSRFAVNLTQRRALSSKLTKKRTAAPNRV